MKVTALNQAESANNSAVPKLAFSVIEAATAIGVSPITIYRMLARGVIRASTACRHKIIPRSELERFLRETLE